MDKLTDYELELLIQQVEEHEMLNAPARLKDEILEKSQHIQSTQIKPLPQRRITRTAARAELIAYSFKTAAAVAVAVFLFAFVNHPALQTKLCINRDYNWENDSVYTEEGRFMDGDSSWDNWDSEQTPKQNWMIFNILQEVNRKMDRFLGGFVW